MSDAIICGIVVMVFCAVSALIGRLFAQAEIIKNLESEADSMRRIIGHMERENRSLRKLCGLEEGPKP